MSLQLFNGANIAKQVHGNDLIVIEGATITVKDEGDNLVPIFDDKAGTLPKLNPFIADDTGSFSFYIQPNQYVLTVVKGAVIGQALIDIGVSGEVTPTDIDTDILPIPGEFTLTTKDHGKMFNVYNTTGSVAITVPVVPIDSTGMIVFIHSDTNSDIQFVPDVGVTIESAYSLIVYAKFSTVAIIAKSETVWSLVGDLRQ